MTISELIRNNYKPLRKALRECYKECLLSGGETESQVYIWEDGQIETHETTGNTWLQSRSDFELYFVATVRTGLFDWRDEVVDSLDDMSEDEQNALRDEIIDSLVDEYDPDLLLDMRLRELEDEEE